MARRVMIIREDNNVTIDGVGANVDCSSLPEDIHAIWFDGDDGTIEYVPNPPRPQDKPTDIAPYQHLLDAWKVKRAEIDAEIKRRKDEVDAANAKMKAAEQSLKDKPKGKLS
jgi:hypothetical protein